ncbi:MAG: CHAT domain-containing protein, partial [Gemmatimonadales bacterium]
FTEAERLYRTVGDMTGLAAAVQGRAQLELESFHYDDVIRDLTPVVTVQPAGRERAWSNLLLGAAHARAGQADSARAAITAAHDDFERVGDPAGVAVALGARAQVEVENDRPLRALRLLEDARARGSGLPAIQWWLYHQTGRALEAVRDLSSAAAYYDTAIGVIEGLADWVRFDDRRSMYLEDKWEPYAALARLRAQRGETAAALAISERLRARYLLDQLARRRDASRAEGQLRARERQLAQRISELTARLRLNENGQRGPVSMGTDEVREDLLATQAAYRRLIDRMRSEEPEYVGQLRGETVRVDAIRRALKPDQLFIEYLVADDQLWIFTVSDRGVAQTSVTVGRAALRAQIDFARWALETQPEREELWRGALKGLDDLLLDPVRRTGLMEERKTLIVVPHLELHYLPFESLIDTVGGRDRFLIQDYDVVYVPSASVWLRLRERPLNSGTGILGLAPIGNQLSGTEEEVNTLRSAWGEQAKIWRGSAATETALRGASGYKVVHLATRGVLNRHNPLFSYVQLSRDAEQDGRLEVHEVFQLGMHTELIVLSACQTALGSGSVGDVPAGDDWIGLVRAFIHAGADNVAATLWAVDDLRTAEFVAAFYRRLVEGVSYVHALAEAKREAIRSADLAHPYYWAGFVLTGAPRD